MTFRNFEEFLVTQAARFGALPAIIADRRSLTYADLERRSREVGAALQALGIRQGDRVAVWLPSSPEWVEIYLACARIGAIMVAINPRFKSKELSVILEKARARVLVLGRGFRGIDTMGVLADLPASATDTLDFVISVCATDMDTDAAQALPRAAWLPFERLTAQGPLTPIEPSIDVPCAIFVTSGTTSGPKLALHSQDRLLIHAHDIARAHGFLEPATVVLAALPLCGQFAFIYLMGGLAAGVPVVLTEVFDPREMAEAMIRLRVTNMTGPDDLFYQILDQVEQTPAFPDLRFATYGCFNSPPESFIKTTDDRGLRGVGCYGSTELQGVIALQPPDSNPTTRMRSGGIISNPDAKVRVRDPETGTILPQGERGAIEIATPTLMLRYFNDEEATRAAITEDGYFRTGDFGYVRADNDLVFLTRMNDALRLSGFLVDPLEIAGHIELHPSVLSCQVVSGMSPNGARPVAFLILREGQAFDEAALRQHCERALAKFKVPVRFVPVANYPVIVGANGEKVQRQVLKERADALLAEARPAK